MTANFETELSALLDLNDSKKMQHAKKQKIEQDEAADFLEAFREIAERLIRPALEEIKVQLESRGRVSRIEAELTGVNHEGKEQAASISIYFNLSQDKYVSRLHEYPHVSFNCDKRGKLVRVHESTIGPNHGGHSGATGSFSLNEITENAVKAEVMKVLKEIPL